MVILIEQVKIPSMASTTAVVEVYSRHHVHRQH